MIAVIDYGLGKTNIDEKGYRYGIIHQNEVLQAWCDSSEPVYYYVCPECEHEIGEDYQDICPNCNKEFDDLEFDYLEPLNFTFEDSEYSAFSDDYGDIMILKSPYFTYAQFCSPCAPGAIYLMNNVNPNENNKGYCFGHDWFESGKAPYPIYSVKTGKTVNP